MRRIRGARTENLRLIGDVGIAGKRIRVGVRYRLKGGTRGGVVGVADEVEPTREAFFRAMEDDVDTPNALVLLARAESEGRNWVAEGAEVLGLLLI